MQEKWILHGWFWIGYVLTELHFWCECMFIPTLPCFGLAVILHIGRVIRVGIIPDKQEG